jgi:polyhydroxyalkanoate synthesis regulator phasin
MSVKKSKKNDDGIIDSIIDLVRTSVYAGLGLAFLGEEKIEDLAKKVAKQNNLSTRDMQSFIRDMKKQSSVARQDVQKRMKTLINGITPSGGKKSSSKGKGKSSRKSGDLIDKISDLGSQIKDRIL